MVFREDGRIQELVDENEKLKKDSADLAAKYAEARGTLKYGFGFTIFISLVVGSVSAAFFAPLFFSGPNSQDFAREVVAQISRNPRLAHDRQSAVYLKEKIVMSAYREGVREAREEFEASRLVETQARPVVSAEGRDLTKAPVVPVLPLNQVIYGRLVGGDGESYLFHAQAGERVVFRMQATVGSILYPHISLFRENHQRLAYTSFVDSSYISLEYTFSSSGTYVVFCGYQHHEYRNFGSYALSARHR
ncbi:hypothetical protein HYT45_01450 [Candidatus Uhrbacteria bacterium]|nr:hypothetical protein [Candidatus Uhrbacteria bacterium]